MDAVKIEIVDETSGAVTTVLYINPRFLKSLRAIPPADPNAPGNTPVHTIITYSDNSTEEFFGRLVSENAGQSGPGPVAPTGDLGTGVPPPTP